MSKLLFAVFASTSFGATCQGAEFALSAAGDGELLLGYIDPGAAGFVIVSILGFISSVGYLARSYLGKVKRKLFGHGAADPDDTDSETSLKGTDDGEATSC